MTDNRLLPAKSKMYIYKETSAQSAMHTVTSKGHAVKSASLGRRTVANSDRAPPLFTRVYISKQIGPRVKTEQMNRLRPARVLQVVLCCGCD